MIRSHLALTRTTAAEGGAWFTLPTTAGGRVLTPRRLRGLPPSLTVRRGLPASMTEIAARGRWGRLSPPPPVVARPSCTRAPPPSHAARSGGPVSPSGVAEGGPYHGPVTDDDAATAPALA